MCPNDRYPTTESGVTTKMYSTTQLTGGRAASGIREQPKPALIRTILATIGVRHGIGILKIDLHELAVPFRASLERNWDNVYTARPPNEEPDNA